MHIKRSEFVAIPCVNIAPTTAEHSDIPQIVCIMSRLERSDLPRFYHRRLSFYFY